MSPDQDPRNSSWQRAKGLSLPVASNTKQVTVRFSPYQIPISVPVYSYPNFEGEHPGGGQGPSTSLPLPSTSLKDLRLDGYLEYPHAAIVLYIYKHPCLLWDSNPVPTAQQSVSQTTIPNGRLKMP
ncbi:uncharacterized protein TNCV_4366641 [Trichonephila clavipes]|nr:uncharacterized protein TNCV_4366641 [Trichonephila clavipes]